MPRLFTGILIFKSVKVYVRGERWRSVGPIMGEMKNYYLESRSRGISYMK
jgi:hypothetical protein